METVARAIKGELIMCKYYIYDNENECFLSISFADFEDAERYMMKLDAEYERYDIYEKIA